MTCVVMPEDFYRASSLSGPLDSRQQHAGMTTIARHSSLITFHAATCAAPYLDVLSTSSSWSPLRTTLMGMPDAASSAMTSSMPGGPPNDFTSSTTAVT